LPGDLSPLSPLEAGWVEFESIGNSQIGTLLIQHAGWEGGQHGWDDVCGANEINGLIQIIPIISRIGIAPSCVQPQ
jgi:hypothetical protein